MTLELFMQVRRALSTSPFLGSEDVTRSPGLEREAFIYAIKI